MRYRNVETESIFKWVILGTGRLTWYALHCRSRKLSYRAFVDELETLRRDVLRTPDGVIMHPESNDALDMVAITAGWNAMQPGDRGRLHARGRQNL